MSSATDPEPTLPKKDEPVLTKAELGTKSTSAPTILGMTQPMMFILILILVAVIAYLVYRLRIVGGGDPSSEFADY